MKNDRQNRQKWDKKGRNNGTFKYLSSFLRTIEMLWVNCEININLTWSRIAL